MEVQEILDGLPVVGGHPAADFVNTLMVSLKKDYLATFSSTVVWFREMGLVSTTEADLFAQVADDSREAMQALSGLSELRLILHQLIYAIADGEAAEPAVVEQFRRLHADAAAHLDLRWGNDAGHFTLDILSDDPRLLLWRMTRLAADLVTTPHQGRLRSCARRPACDWVFLDTSKAGRRRWCTPHICGNRMRLRAFMARHAGAIKQTSTA